MALIWIDYPCSTDNIHASFALLCHEKQLIYEIRTCTFFGPTLALDYSPIGADRHRLKPMFWGNRSRAILSEETSYSMSPKAFIGAQSSDFRFGAFLQCFR